MVNKATNNDLGYMALNKKFGFIFLDNNTDIAHTIAHEIGHGNLVLKHTFAAETSGSSQNLMDYNNGELFNQEQFKAIHDPNIIQNFINTLVQDEDIGAFKFFDLEEWLKDKLGITCYNTYQNYDGVMPECFWNNSLQDNLPDNGYGCALVCGVIDGVFVTVRDLYSVLDFISCYTLLSSTSTHCLEIQTQTATTVQALKQVLDKPNGYKTLLLEFDKAIGNWAGETFCTDRTCAYNQGRLIFDVVSLFYGAGEAKALLKTGAAGNRIAKMISEIDKTALAVIKCLRASSLKAQKITAGFLLSVELNTGVFFDIGKLEAANKALRFNVPPMVSSALPDAEIITRLDNVAYIVQENGVAVVKHGSIDIVDNGATALPRVGTNTLKFTSQQIDNYVIWASKQNDKTKIMLGRWDNCAPSSYVSRAGNDYSYFAMGYKWEEASNIVGGNFNEMWRINKKYIDNQKALNKEFFFSHDPFSPTNDVYFAYGVNYLIELGVTDFQLVGTNLWKAIW